MIPFTYIFRERYLYMDVLCLVHVTHIRSVCESPGFCLYFISPVYIKYTCRYFDLFPSTPPNFNNIYILRQGNSKNANAMKFARITQSTIYIYEFTDVEIDNRMANSESNRRWKKCFLGWHMSSNNDKNRSMAMVKWKEHKTCHERKERVVCYDSIYTHQHERWQW